MSNTFRPLVEEASTKSTKDRVGWKRGETLRFIPIKTCLACFIIVVVIGALVYSLVHVWAPHDSAGASRQYLSTRKALRVTTTSVSAVTTTLRPRTLAPTLATTLAPPLKVDKKSCSCRNTAAPPNCCRRTIYRAHKFGTILVDSLFDSFTRPTSKHRIAVEQIPKLVDANSTLPTRDYRHVVVTRNWLDAIISGYLYHKAGYECWMNARGEPKRIVRRDEWDTHLSFHQRGGISFPPRNNRSICSYLVEESEEDGIRVLMDIALSKWYKGVVPFWRIGTTTKFDALCLLRRFGRSLSTRRQVSSNSKLVVSCGRGAKCHVARRTEAVHCGAATKPHSLFGWTRHHA